MNWLPWIFIGGVIVVFYVLRRLALVSPERAGESLRAGAKVIDVRSEEEFRQNHLPGAINIPLNQLREEINRQVPDKEQPILLHCLSGGRSGIGKSVLKGMGYRRCFNLGSLGRARKILAGTKQPKT